MDMQTEQRVTWSLAVVAAFVGIYFIWGTTYLAIAVSIQTIPPFISGGARFLLASAAMYLWLRARGPRPFAGLDWRLAALCGVLLTGMGNGFVGWGQQEVPSGIAALIVTAVPVNVLVLDWIFFSKRVPTRQALMGTAIALAGVVTIITHTHTLNGDAKPIYLLVVLVATLAWSFGTLLQKRVASADSIFSFTCVQMLGGGMFQVFMSVVTGEWHGFAPRSMSLNSVMAVLYLVVFGSIIAINCYLFLLTRVPAPKVTTYALVNPVVALLLGALVLNEQLTGITLAAAVLVLIGVTLVLFQGVRWRRAVQGMERVTEITK